MGVEVTGETAAGATAAGSGRGRLVFRNTVLNGGSVLFTIALSFLLVPFAIDRLGAPAYGVWVLAISFSLSGGYLSLSDLGLQQGVVKFVAEASATDDRHAVSRLVSTALAVFTLMTAVAVVVVTILWSFGPEVLNVPDRFHGALRMLLLLVGIEAAVGLPGLAFLAVLEGLQRYDAIRIVDFGRQLLYAAVVVGVLSAGGDVVAFGSAMTISTAVGSAGYFVAAKRLLPQLSISVRNVRASELRRLTSFSGWVMVSKVTGVLWRQMDKIILAAMLTTSVLTSYDIANKVQAAAAAMLAFTGWAVMPAASSLAAGNERERLQELLVRGTRYVLALSFPVVIGAIIMARPLIVHWVGSDFGDVASATQLFLALQFLVSLAIVANNLLVGLGRIRTITLYAGAAAVINLAVSVVLVRRLALFGVILGTLVGYGITSPLYVRLALRDLGVSARHFFRHAIAPLLPWAIVFAFAVEVLRRAVPPTSLGAVFGQCAAGLLLYATGVLFVGFSRDERRMLRNFVVRPRSA